MPTSVPKYFGNSELVDDTENSEVLVDPVSWVLMSTFLFIGQ